MKILERKDVERVWKGVVSDFIAHPPSHPEHFEVRVTSGTSGEALIMTVQKRKESHGNTLRRVQCRGSMGVRFKYVLQALLDQPHMHTRVIALDETDMEETLGPLMADYIPDAMWGAYSMIVRTSEYLDQETRAAISSVVFGGARVDDTQYRLAQTRFPSAKLKTTYNAVEIGGIVDEACEYLPFHYYHPAPGVDIEINDPDENGVGDMLVSATLTGNVRVEHYRIGDIGRLVSRSCPCGNTTTFEVLGRRGFDYVKLAGTVLRREEWDRVAGELKLYDDYRVEASKSVVNGKVQGKVLLRIFRRDGIGTPALAQEIADRVSRAVYVTKTRTYAEIADAGHLERLKIEFSSKPLQSGKKEIKIFER